MGYRNGQEAALYGQASAVDLFLGLLGSGLILITGMSRLRSPRWWIRAADFPRVQVGLALAVVTACVLWRIDEAGLWAQVFAAALIVCLCYQSLRIFPYTPVAPARSATPRRMTRPTASEC